MIGIKTQTKRATKWQERVTNVNLFYGNFQLGIVTSKSWGDFEVREEPLITIDVGDQYFEIPMSELIAKLTA